MAKALLVIDMQGEYIEKYPSALLKRINKRIEKSALDKEMIIYIKNTKALRSEKYTDNFAAGLSLCSEFVICKEKADAFSNSALQSILVQNRITEVELVGIDGNSCIAKTAIGAINHGYKTILQNEYIGIQNLERYENTKKSLLARGIVII